MLVYETFHATLAKEFPEAIFFVYVDDIAVVTNNANDLQRVMKRVQELSLILGFQTNPGKIEVYKWATTRRVRQKRQVPQHNVLRWNGKDTLVRPPIFRYLGHIMAHPSWAQRAKDEVLAKVEFDLTRYRALPLNAFEWVQLLNSVLIPRWLYHTMFIPRDRMFQHIDKICLEFVAIAKGLEHNKENIYKAHNVIHINSPVKYGGLGLQQICWLIELGTPPLFKDYCGNPLVDYPDCWHNP